MAAMLLRNAGFDSIKVSGVRNKYPIDYWIKLFSPSYNAQVCDQRLAKAIWDRETIVASSRGQLSSRRTKANYPGVSESLARTANTV